MSYIIIIIKTMNYTHYECTVSSGRARYNNGVTTTSGEGSTMSGLMWGLTLPKSNITYPMIVATIIQPGSRIKNQIFHHLTTTHGVLR